MSFIYAQSVFSKYHYFKLGAVYEQTSWAAWHAGEGRCESSGWALSILPALLQHLP